MNLPELFKNYLKTQKVSSVTIKNYVADINNFFNWLEKKTQIKYQVAGTAVLGLFTKETIEEYKNDQDAPLSTINRRLSALRKFGSFIQAQGWINNNPALEITNSENQKIRKEIPKDILIDFKQDLEKENISAVTIKNYLSDLRHFLSWLKEA